jgi:uncharacterized membrane protein (UPF0127 family)
MRPGWLLRDGEVLAAAEIADGRLERARSLAGRPHYDHALVLPGARVGHTLGVPCRLDVAFVDQGMRVRSVAVVGSWRVVAPRPGGRHLVAASAGSFERWGLHAGDTIEVRETS